jgi:hypothetical protein
MKKLSKTVILLLILGSSISSCSLFKTAGKENESAISKNVDALQQKQDVIVRPLDSRDVERNRPK